MDRREWMVNGGVKGDEEGNWTYTGGRGESVINYVLVEELAREEILSMEVKEYVESDHHPLVVRLRRGGGRGREKRGRKGERRMCRGRWDEEGREMFTRELRRELVVEGEVEEVLKNVEDKVRKILGRMEEGIERITRKGKGW